MKHKLWLTPVALAMLAASQVDSQAVIQNYPTYPSNTSTTTYSTSNVQPAETPPPIIYQNSLTAPPIINPSASLPGAPLTTPSGLPGLPTSSQAVLPGNSTTPQPPTLLQTLYPQGNTQPTVNPNQPQPAYLSQQQQVPGIPGPALNFTPKPYEVIAPPESYLPGIATIKNKRWVVTDFLYNLTNNIEVKVEILKPKDQYIPLSENLLAQQVSDLFQKVNITPSAVQMNCRPPLPIFYVLIMAYPCDKRIVGFISAQLYEEAKPVRIDLDLNGVWQTITWERQAMVASAPGDFAQEVNEVVTQMVVSFTDKFKYYHPADERKCFPE